MMDMKRTFFLGARLGWGRAENTIMLPQFPEALLRIPV